MFKKSPSILIIFLALRINLFVIAESSSFVKSKDFNTIVTNTWKMVEEKLEKTKELTKEDIEIVQFLFDLFNHRIDELEREVSEAEYWHLRQGR